MARQSTRSSFKRFSLLSKDFYSPSDLFPWEYNVVRDDNFSGAHEGITYVMPAATVGGLGTTALAAYNAYPMSILGGYAFGASCNRPVMTGIFSPHHIIEPSKDTVDLKAYVWWLGPYVESAAASKQVNWIANLAMLKDAVPSNQALVPLTNIVQSMVFPNDLMAPIAITNPLSEATTESRDGEGNPDWTYWFMKAGGATQKKVTQHPYSQWAVGGEATVVADTSDASLTAPFTIASSLAPVCFYRTPLDFISLPSVAGEFVADGTVSFKDFSANLESSPVGCAISLWRWSPAVQDGDLRTAYFNPVIPADNDTNEFTDAITGFVFGPLVMVPIFVGMEFEVQ